MSWEPNVGGRGDDCWLVDLRRIDASDTSYDGAISAIVSRLGVLYRSLPRIAHCNEVDVFPHRRQLRHCCEDRSIRVVGMGFLTRPLLY